jgi:hypothetical protein
MTRSLLLAVGYRLFDVEWSLTRGRVCHLPESQSEVISLLPVCTIYILHVIKRLYIDVYVCINVCVYNIYQASVSLYF